MCYLCDYVAALDKPPFALLATTEDSKQDVYPLYQGQNVIKFRHLPATMELTILPDGSYTGLSIEPDKTRGPIAGHKLEATVMVNRQLLQQEDGHDFH